IVVGYGDTLQVPTIDLIFSEISIVGSLVGNHAELRELMTLHAQGKVRLRTRRYRLDDVNQAIDDLEQGRIQGRAVLVP
ncbi:MAG TPA: zinc-binding dehydrogenase, partial [Candidatus Dormibacteraeota bacterium]|nr:zinc-binding dehydrogenase [Candidatus Dormibacteraeota bacterium]